MLTLLVLEIILATPVGVSMQATDCSFLYFNLEVLDAVLSELCTRPEEARKLPYILAAFSDAHSLLSTSTDNSGPSHEVRVSPACFCQY